MLDRSPHTMIDPVITSVQLAELVRAGQGQAKSYLLD
jgi:hypothetical protein